MSYLHGSYGQESPSNTSLTLPDKNWVDPVKINRLYLKKIQKDCVLEEFKGLKKKCLFLFEIFIDSVQLKSQIAENLILNDKAVQTIESRVQLLDLPFVDVNVIDDVVKCNKTDCSPLYTDLLQKIYSVTGEHVMKVPDLEDARSVGEEEKSTRSSVASVQLDNEGEDQENDKVAFEIFKGKSVMFSMSGLEMIQALQKHPVSVKVDSTDITIGEEKIEGETLGISFIRLPERFRLSVLRSIKHDAVLPSKEVKTESYKLLDSEQDEVGDVSLTIALTCFGNPVVNSFRELGDGRLKYGRTELLRSLKSKQSEEKYPAVNPSLALEILRMGLPLSGPKSSKEILEQCLDSNLFQKISKDRNDLVKKDDDCMWYKMVKESLPKKPTSSVDFNTCREARIDATDRLWRKHLKFIRDLNLKDDTNAKRWDSLIKELQIQSDLSKLDGNSMFVHFSPVSTVKSLEISEQSIPESRRNYSPKTSLTKRKF